MPIKNSITGTIPNLTAFTPYVELNLEENVNNMFSYNIIPSSVPVNIDYLVGGDASPFIATLEVSNLTENAPLSVKIIYNNELFTVVCNEYTEIQSVFDSRGTVAYAMVAKLQPMANKQFDIFLSRSVTDSTKALERILTDLELIVTFDPIGDLVKKTNKFPLEKIELPASIQFV